MLLKGYHFLHNSDVSLSITIFVKLYFLKKNLYKMKEFFSQFFTYISLESRLQIKSR
jgi:hypothetical protein